MILCEHIIIIQLRVYFEEEIRTFDSTQVFISDIRRNGERAYMKNDKLALRAEIDAFHWPQHSESSRFLVDFVFVYSMFSCSFAIFDFIFCEHRSIIRNCRARLCTVRQCRLNVKERLQRASGNYHFMLCPGL